MLPDELRAELHALGIDESVADVLKLLPLVMVAWSDDDVHPRERGVIEAIAKERALLSEGAARVLETWLTHRPSSAYISRARALIRKLAPDRGNALAMAEQVARASRDIFGRVNKHEKEALHAIEMSMELPMDSVPGLGLDPREWDDDLVTQTRPIPHADGPPVAGARGLAVWVGEGDERVVPLEDAVVIGRAPGAGLQLVHDSRVSRQHARVFRKDDKVFVRDLGAINGVLVNGERVVERQLFGGETITLGETVVRYRG